MLSRLNNWTHPVEGLRLALNAGQARPRKSKNKAISDTSKTVNELVLPHHATREAEVTLNDILTLRRAFRHTISSHLHTILANAELLSFSSSLFSSVSPLSLSFILALIIHPGDYRFPRHP